MLCSKMEFRHLSSTTQRDKQISNSFITDATFVAGSYAVPQIYLGIYNSHIGQVIVWLCCGIEILRLALGSLEHLLITPRIGNYS